MSDHTMAAPSWPRRQKRRGPPRRWRQRANEAIVAAIAAGKEQGLTGRALELFVSRNGYPFEVRACHPYRVWLHEFHRVLHGSRMPFDDRARKRLRARRAGQGQLVLFE